MKDERPMTSPRDWYTPTTIDGEPAYWMTREGVIFYTIKTDGDVATRAQVEIANIVTAWYRGEIFPRSAAPTMLMILDSDKWEEKELPPTSPEPVEIVGGVAGLQKLLVEMAKKNRGLDHAALKELYETHELVTAVWEAEDNSRGPGFLTLKGTEHLLAQVKRGTKKFRATMTAFWANSREHAEILQQAFRSQ
jgi:hypothetical protein